jgi:hypothetical protein
MTVNSIHNIYALFPSLNNVAGIDLGEPQIAFEGVGGLRWIAGAGT